MWPGRTVNSVFPSDKCLTGRCPRTVSSSATAVRLSRKLYPMHPHAILHEVQQLYNVNDRLDSWQGISSGRRCVFSYPT
jgi:hypothetical protein